MKQEVLTNFQIADICREMAMMIHAGVGLGDGLTLLSEEESGDMKALLENLGHQMDEGTVFSDALKSCGRFPAYVTAMTAVGEETGRLEETLLSLAQYYEDREMLERQISSALLYPSILMILMLTVIVVLLTKVMPMFEAAYQSLGAGLTGMALGLLKLGEVLNSLLPILCILLGLVVGSLIVCSVSRSVRERVVGLWYKVRGDRGIARKINDSRFVQAMSMGVRSGLSMEEAVEQSVIVWEEIPQAYDRGKNCLEDMRTGADPEEALLKNGILSPAACRLLSLGLKGGNADAAMEEISRRLTDEAAFDMERKISRIEPAMVLTTSLLVGLILLAVMLPLINIMSVIG